MYFGTVMEKVYNGFFSEKYTIISSDKSLI